jgi:hypothetical protein
MPRRQRGSVIVAAVRLAFGIGGGFPDRSNGFRRSRAERTKDGKSAVFNQAPFQLLHRAAHHGAALRLPGHTCGVVWIYVREHDEVWCEERSAESGFELLISHKDGAEEIQHWSSAETVRSQRRVLERCLIDDGWRLKAFYATLTKPGKSEAYRCT